MTQETSEREVIDNEEKVSNEESRSSEKDSETSEARESNEDGNSGLVDEENLLVESDEESRAMENAGERDNEENSAGVYNEESCSSERDSETREVRESSQDRNSGLADEENLLVESDEASRAAENTGERDSMQTIALTDRSVDLRLIAREIQEDFPHDFYSEHLPTLKDLIHVGPKRDTRYESRDWVEIRGPDMLWRLAQLTRVVKIEENEGENTETTFRFDARSQRDILEKDIRAPEEGLRCVFGSRPWVWQQWACLKLENALRFQDGHGHDFMLFDVKKYVADLWDMWLNHPSNTEFKQIFQDDRVGDVGRSELLDHIMKPFELIDEMKNGEGDWDFSEDGDISVYTYLSFLGSGWVVALAMAGIQIAVPMLILRTTMFRRSDFINDFLDFFTVSNVENLDDLDNIQGVVIAVLILYLFRIIPENFCSFFRVVGPSRSVYSRIRSFREQVWLQQEDRVGQIIGYKADTAMNTLYIVAVYAMNIYIIINSDDALDIILNSLAFEFILSLDEEVVTSSWYDPRRRWLIAGSIEIVLQYTLELRLLKSAKTFCEKYDITVDKMNQAKIKLDETENFIHDPERAAKDTTDTKFMTAEEEKNFRFANVAKQRNLQNAIAEFQKPAVYFDPAYYYFATKILGTRFGGMFNRYQSYRCWSRWEKILFISDVPELSGVFGTDGVRVSDDLDLVKHTTEKPFANISSISSECNIGTTLFIRRGLEILSLRYLVNEIKKSWSFKDHFRLLIKPTLDFFTLWLAYVAQVLFPVYIVVVLIVVVVTTIQTRD